MLHMELGPVLLLLKDFPREGQRMHLFHDAASAWGLKHEVQDAIVVEVAGGRLAGNIEKATVSPEERQGRQAKRSDPEPRRDSLPFKRIHLHSCKARLCQNRSGCSSIKLATLAWARTIC